MSSSSVACFEPHASLIHSLPSYHLEGGCGVAVPATSANLGVGFDTFGLALGIWNYFVIHRLESSVEPSLCAFDGSSYSLGKRVGWEAVHNNICFEAFRAFYSVIQRPMPPYAVQVHVNVPVARGLGSSATAVIAAIMAANHFEGSPMDDEALLRFAIGFEGHPDNVAPALQGGVVLGNATEAMPLPWPAQWHTAVWIPEDALLTEAARQVLPATYPRSVVVEALRHSALFTHAVHQADATLFSTIVESDQLHEPYRGGIIQGFKEFRQFMHDSGLALGTVISGSGSTCLSFIESSHSMAMEPLLQEWVRQWGGQYRILPVESQGAFFFQHP
jgi:homoserine kinase